VALLGVSLAVFLPGQCVLPPIDRDESRFAEASRQMVVAANWRDWIVPLIQGRPRLNKPPLLYWLQALSVKVTAWAGAPVPTAAQSGPAGPLPHSDVRRDDSEQAASFAIRYSPFGIPQAPAEVVQSLRAAEALPDGGIWAYRIPSILGALAAVLITWRIGCSMFAGGCGWLAGLLLASCLVVVVDVRQARTDQVLLAWTCLAQWALWKLWRRRRGPQSEQTGWVVLLWVGLGLGIMTKGPVAPAIALLTVSALGVVSREWAWLRRLHLVAGVVLVLAIVTPWVVLVGEQVGWREYGGILLDEVWGRSTSAKEGHWAPPGYYLVLLPLLFWPGSLGLVPGLVRGVRRGLRFGQQPTASDAGPGRSLPATGPAETGSGRESGWLRRIRRRWQQRAGGHAAELYLLAWLVPGWVIFELVATKLPHYTLPMFPALALLCARALCGGERVWTPLVGAAPGTPSPYPLPQRGRGVAAPARGRGVADRSRGIGVVRAALNGWLVLSAVVGVAAPILLAWLGVLEVRPGLFKWLSSGAALCACLLLMLICAVRRRRFVRAQVLAVLLGALSVGGTLQFVLPNLQHLWLSSRVVAVLRMLDPEGVRPLAAAEYQEDSLVFLTEGRLERLRLRELPDWLAAHADGLAVVVERDDLSLPLVVRRASVRGFNYSKGRMQTLLIIGPDRLAAPPEVPPGGK